MYWKPFHHPDISLPVIKHKVGNELLTLLACTADFVRTQGRNELYGACYPNQRAFRASKTRLEKKGLIVSSTTDGSFPKLTLTPVAKENLPVYLDPYKFWSKKWDKWWYVLMFDVPEKERHYRNTLRKFLKSMRFGCLQKSVWVSPWDVRPEYDDLDRAAGVGGVAFLLEARTVLGHGDQSIVQEAWNFDQINDVQSYYIKVATENLTLLNKSGVAESGLMQLLRMSIAAYEQAMSIDPLLPEELHPSDYAGKSVAELHKELIQKIMIKLKK